jgi:hypothetical protein
MPMKLLVKLLKGGGLILQAVYNNEKSLINKQQQVLF